MRVFVTGATGFIGSALVPELTRAGHSVLGMTRTSEGAQVLRSLGADPHMGSLDDLESLKAGASAADAVIHLAFIHDFSNFQDSCAKDQRAIAVMADALAGSDRPLIGTAGVLVDTQPRDRPLEEDDPKPATGFPRFSEEATLAAVDRGVRGIVMRLSQIHDTHRQGLVSFMIQVALQKGVSAYVGNGSNRWAAAHVSDTVKLYTLALEKAEAGSRWHAVGEEGVSAKAIAESIGQRLNLPVVSISAAEAADHFGFLAHFMGLDAPTSNTKTRERLGWNPTGPTLISDLNNLVLPAND